MVTLQLIDNVFINGKCANVAFGTFTVLVGIFVDGMLKKYAILKYNYKENTHYLVGIKSAKDVDSYKVIVKQKRF